MSKDHDTKCRFCGSPLVEQRNTCCLEEQPDSVWNGTSRWDWNGQRYVWSHSPNFTASTLQSLARCAPILHDATGRELTIPKHWETT